MPYNAKTHIPDFRRLNWRPGVNWRRYARRQRLFNRRTLCGRFREVASKTGGGLRRRRKRRDSLDWSQASPFFTPRPTSGVARFHAQFRCWWVSSPADAGDENWRNSACLALDLPRQPAAFRFEQEQVEKAVRVMALERGLRPSD